VITTFFPLTVCRARAPKSDFCGQYILDQSGTHLGPSGAMAHLTGDQSSLRSTVTDAEVYFRIHSAAVDPGTPNRVAIETSPDFCTTSTSRWS